MRYLLGIDDTDELGRKPGTGRLARELAASLAAEGGITPVGVVRHQLLVDPRIPYTSHNSPACIILESAESGTERARRAFASAAGYVRSRCAPGSDPGICLAPADSVSEDLICFGHRAASEVLTKAEAATAAKRAGVLLSELGGTGDGVIGALAAVGLTANGNAGRFLELAGDLRELADPVPAATLTARDVTLISVSRDAETVPAHAMIFTDGWIRPRLIGHRPVLLVERTESGWRCFDRKKQKSREGGESEQT
jgi:hypothetical protein